MAAWITFQVAPRGLDKDRIKDPLVLTLPFPANPIWVMRVKSVRDFKGMEATIKASCTFTRTVHLFCVHTHMHTHNGVAHKCRRDRKWRKRRVNGLRPFHIASSTAVLSTNGSIQWVCAVVAKECALCHHPLIEVLAEWQQQEILIKLCTEEKWCWIYSI